MSVSRESCRSIYIPSYTPERCHKKIIFHFVRVYIVLAEDADEEKKKNTSACPAFISHPTMQYEEEQQQEQAKSIRTSPRHKSVMSVGPLHSDHINYLILRYLQEAGHENAALAFYRDWHRPVKYRDPENLPFAKVVQRHELISVVQEGLRHDELNNSITLNPLGLNGVRVTTRLNMIVSIRYACIQGW